jgi:hypothetical protein
VGAVRRRRRRDRAPVGLDHRQHRADVEGVTGGPAQPRDHSVRRARDDDRRLVGLDLDEVLVLGHLIALGHLPGNDLGRRDALPDVGQAELERRHQLSSAAGPRRARGRPRARRAPRWCPAGTGVS